MAIKCGVFKTNYRDDAAIWQTKASRFWLVLLVIALMAFPFVFQGSRYMLYVVNSVLIAVIAAVGLNILTGFTGQISLGHGAFMGVGAYASGYFMIKLGMPFIACVVAAGFVTAIVGMIFGIPSLRLKGLYLAIATLAAQVILEFVFVRWRDVTGGSQGLMVPPAAVGGIAFNSDFKFYFLALGFTILAVMAAKNIIRTKPGRAFMAIRDRYISAEIIGIPIFRYKLMSFGISSFFAGVAGSLWAHYLGIITPEHFGVMTSIQYLSMIIIGRARKHLWKHPGRGFHDPSAGGAPVDQRPFFGSISVADPHLRGDPRGHFRAGHHPFSDIRTGRTGGPMENHPKLLEAVAVFLLMQETGFLLIEGTVLNISPGLE